MHAFTLTPASPCRLTHGHAHHPSVCTHRLVACLVGESLSGASTAAAVAVMRRKEAALRALGQLCGATGVISEVSFDDARASKPSRTTTHNNTPSLRSPTKPTPKHTTQAYLGFPSLFPAITAILQQGGDREAAIVAPRRRACPTGARVLPLLLASSSSSSSSSAPGGGGYYHQTLREEALRAVGVLGALSPALYADIVAAAAAEGLGFGGGGGSGGGEKGKGGGAPGGKGAGGGGGGGRVSQLLLGPAAAMIGLEEQDEEEEDEEESDEDEGGQTLSLLPLESLYPHVAARALLQVLGDAQAPAQHPAALATLMSVARLALGGRGGGSGTAGGAASAALVKLLVRGFAAAMRRREAAVEFKVRICRSGHAQPPRPSAPPS